MDQPRKIIHIDMDAFYASVELRDRPDLRGLPMVVASDHARAVVTTATYEARKFGLRSAMSVYKAKQLCPHVICITPDFAKYRAVSEVLHQIFQRYTPMVEAVSLDEAYLDVTENLKGLASATEVAEHIRAEIEQETGLTASAGVAPNKFIAKIASDWHKPNGICVVKPAQVTEFIQALSLDKIPGVGRVTLQKMHSHQWYMIADLLPLKESELIAYFGKFGKNLYQYVRGIDHRPVVYQRERQQISKEVTFEQNIDWQLLRYADIWMILLQKVWELLQQKNLKARGIQIKLKDQHFKTLQYSKAYPQSFESFEQLRYAMQQLHDIVHVDTDQYFRLAGIGVYHLEHQQSSLQLSFL